MQFNAIAPVFQAMIEYPYEEAGVCRSPSHTFNFGQDAYQIEYLSDMSNLVPESLADDETSWTGVALKAAALSTVAISLFKVAKALSYRYFESKGSMFPELPRDIHVLTAKYLSTKDLLAMRLVSAELKAVADMELIDRLNNGSLFLNHLRLYSLSSLLDFFGDQAKLITRIRVQYPQHVDPPFDITRLGQVSLPSLIDFCGGVAKHIFGNHNPECVDQQFDTTLLDRFPKLTHLTLEDFKLNTDLKSLKHCPHLIHLSLEDRNLITDLSCLQYCLNLTRLDLRGCYRIVDLGFFEFCKNLTYLNLGGSYQLTDFSFLEHFPNLTHLDLTDCEQISDLSFLQSCPHLTHLDLTNCYQVNDFSFLEHCSHLTHLSLNDCNQITDVSFLASCPELTHLEVRSCRQITDLSFLGRCSKVTYLDLGFCRRITDLSFLQHCPNLKSYKACDGRMVHIR